MGLALLNLLMLMMLNLLRPDIIKYKCIAKFEVGLLYKFILGYNVIVLEI